MATLHVTGCQYSLLIKEKPTTTSVSSYSTYANVAKHVTMSYAVEDIEELASSSSAGRYINETLNICFTMPTYFKHIHVEMYTYIPYHHIVYQIIMP